VLGQHRREVAAVGHMMVRKYRGSEVPRPFNPATIKRMIEGPSPLVREQESRI